MKTGYKWIFWLTLALVVLTSAIILTVITDLSLFRAAPLFYLAALTVIATGLGLHMKNLFYLPLLRNLRLPGKLMLAPLLLLILSSPSAIIYIYYDLNGKESLKLLSALFASLAAVFFLATIAVVTLPSMVSVLHIGIGESECNGKTGRLRERTLEAIALFTLVFVLANTITNFDGSGLVIIFPFLALLLIAFDIILTGYFRNALSEKIRIQQKDDTHPDINVDKAEKPKGFRSLLILADHYIDLISGRLDFLNTQADNSFASAAVAVAVKALDPALLPVLSAIKAGSQFSEEVKNEAATACQNIERYYSDPTRNRDLLMLPGISERAAAARGIMLNKRAPHVSEIIKLLSDASPEIRKIGLLATGRFDIRELREEVVQAFCNPETEREAFYVLLQFGPEVFGDIIGTVLRQGNSERENLLIIRLLELMPLSRVLPYLTNFVAGGHISVRLKAARSLCERGYVPEGKQRQMIEQALDETLNTIARLIAMQLEAKKNRYFILTAALDKEMTENIDFLFSLLTLLTGRAAAEVIMSMQGDDGIYRTGIAAEAIDALVDEPLRRPLKALMGNDTDRSRLAELSLYYPVREVKGRSVASFILSSEQNITGVWTKACSLHKVAAEGKGLEREQAVSYLFSNSQLLQEESARAIRNLNPEWYLSVEPRLTAMARSRISTVVNDKLPVSARIFEKTRFLSLCFNNIPEEKIIMLAQSMRYSELYDPGSTPGQVSWVVPSHEGKSGLYSLPVSDIEDFLFHYSEYTDIFVHYMDKQGGLTVY